MFEGRTPYKGLRREGFVGRNFVRLVRTLILLGCCVNPAFAQSRPIPPVSSGSIPVKVVVVAMFEQGEDTGDAPGEYQLWVEREHLDRVLPLPAGYHHVRMNKDGVLGM